MGRVYEVESSMIEVSMNRQLFSITAFFLLVGCNETSTTEDVLDDHQILPTCIRFEAAETQIRLPSNIRLFFSLRDCDGNPIVGLDETAFVVYEDDRAISVFESGLKALQTQLGFQVHVMLLLDLSGSVVASGNLDRLHAGALSFISVMFGEDAEVLPHMEVAIYGFATRTDPIREIVGFTSCPDKLRQGLDDIETFVPSDISTNLYGSIVGAADVLEGLLDPGDDKPIQQTILIILTDGTDTAAMTTNREALLALTDDPATPEEEGVHRTYTLGVGAEIDEHELEELALGGESVMVDEWDDLASAFTNLASYIVNEAGAYYILGSM